MPARSGTGTASDHIRALCEYEIMWDMRPNGVRSRGGSVLRLASVLLMGAATAASSAQVPDQAGIVVPSLANIADPKVQKEGWKHFFFHQDGVSYAQAHGDFTDCYRFLGGVRPVGAPPLPANGAWSRVPGAERAKEPTGGSYGLVGEVMGAMVAGPINRRLLQSRMRQCMEPRGYVRYPLDEKTWMSVIDGYSPGSIAVQAKIASGPRPAVPAVLR